MKRINQFLDRHSKLIGVWASIATILSFVFGVGVLKCVFILGDNNGIIQKNEDGSIVYNGTIYYDSKSKIHSDVELDDFFGNNIKLEQYSIKYRDYVNNLLDDTGYYIDINRVHDYGDNQYSVDFLVYIAGVRDIRFFTSLSFYNKSNEVRPYMYTVTVDSDSFNLEDISLNRSLMISTIYFIYPDITKSELKTMMNYIDYEKEYQTNKVIISYLKDDNKTSTIFGIINQ